MIKTLSITVVLVNLVAGGARADADCVAPLAAWQPRAAVAQMAAARGWTVRRIRIRDGCYTIAGIDAQGRRIAATLHPETLRIVMIAYPERQDGDDASDRPDLTHD